MSYRVADTTRTMHIEVDLDNHDLRIKPGMYAWVDIQVASRKDAIAVPLQALNGDGSPSVWTLTASNTLIERPVVVGIKTADWAEITSGLKPGDKVLFGSPASFAPGEVVTPKTIDPMMASE
jgi:multidrug efflux pump subunit AcrA (membrane-fusion protein)